MPALPSASPEVEEFDRKKSRLAELVARLAERDRERASILAELDHFEREYLRTIGTLREPRRAVCEDRRVPRSGGDPGREDMQEWARQARSRAEESARGRRAWHWPAVRR